MQTAFSKGGSTPQYQWVMNGVDIAGANGASYSSNSLSNNDIISVKFVSSQQCILPSVSNNVVFSVGEKYESKVDITVSYLGDNQYQFQAHPKNGGKAPLYQWFKNGKYIPGATGARYVAENIFHSDKIYVEMVSSDECVQNKVSASKSIGLDVSDITGTLGTFSVYPNPNSGRFTLTGDLTANTNTASIDIINTLGQNVYNSQVAVNNHKLQTAVELDSKLSNGMYTIKVTADGKTSSMRFMLNK